MTEQGPPESHQKPAADPEDADKFARSVYSSHMKRHMATGLSSDSEEDGDSQAWLLTYTDLVTLLLVLFVALLTVANLDPVTPPRDVSLTGMSRPREAAPLADIGVDGLDQGAAVVSSGGARETALGEGNEALRRLRLYVRESGLRGDVDILVSDGLIQLSVRTPVTFEESQSELNLQGRELLLKLAPVLTRIEGRYTVTGGADDLVRVKADQTLVWSMSAARAVAVADVLLDAGVPAERLTLVARSELKMPQADTIGRAGAAGVVISIHQQDDGPLLEEP